MSRLLAAEADPNTSDTVQIGPGEVFQTTALRVCAATANGRLKVALLLLDAVANPYRTDSYGTTPLMSVVGRSHPEVLRLLLTRGAAADAMVSYHDDGTAFPAGGAVRRMLVQYGQLYGHAFCEACLDWMLRCAGHIRASSRRL